MGVLGLRKASRDAPWGGKEGRLCVFPLLLSAADFPAGVGVVVVLVVVGVVGLGKQLLNSVVSSAYCRKTYHNSSVYPPNPKPGYIPPYL